MPLNLRVALASMILLSPSAFADDPKPAESKKDDKPKPEAAKPATVSTPPVSFMKDVAPILVRNCIACHSPKKAESKYIMTNFAQLSKGGVRGEGITLAPGDPDESFFVELIRHDGEPRMPYKQDPLPLDAVGLIERWVKEGAKYDGKTPTEDWTLVFRRSIPISIPEAYPVTVPITALAFSPKGDEIIAGGYHEVNVWKVGDGTLGRRVRTLPERVYEIAYSPDGNFAATAAGDPGQFGSAKLWKVEADGNLTPVRDLVESVDCVYAVAFSPDSKTVAAAGADRAIRVWDVATGKELALIEDHADWIFDLAFSPDGKRLASASRDKTAKVFDVAKKESVATFPGHADTVYAITFSPDGKQVVTAGADNQLRVWNPDEDGKQARNVGGFGGPIFKLQFTPDGKTLVACSADKTLRLFENYSSKQTLSGHTDWIYTFAISPDGKTLASGSWDGEVRLWSLPDGKPIKTILAAPGYKPTVQASAK
jgi:WD40 repeat protein